MMLHISRTRPFKQRERAVNSIRCLAIGAILLLFGCTSPSIQTKPATHQIYVIIDDAGQDYARSASFFNLSVPLTIAVLPDCPSTKSVARAVSSRADKQLILHQPMESLNPNADPGPGAIRLDTPAEEVAVLLKNNMDQVPGAKGMNNHMGSGITQNRELMEAVMAFCKENDLFFIDSLTTPDSVAGQIAREYGVPTAARDVFLDNEHSEAAIQKQFEQGMDIAARRGIVVMIGHTWSPNTATVIRKMYPVAIKKGCTFHTVSDLFEAAQNSRK